MAGIGFELKRAIHEASYVGTMRGYLYAAIISSGPWLLSVLTLGLLGIISIAFLPQESRDLFAATTTHAFALSLVTTGLMQMLVTRYLADKLYVHESDAVAPTFVSVLVLSSLVQFILMHLLFLRTSLPLDYRLPAVSLYLAISGIWVSMTFLSAARDYLSIVVAFAVGYVLSFVSALLLGPRFGAGAYLGGFAAGQMLTLALVVARVLSEFPPKQSYSLTVFSYLRKYPALVAIGLMYNLGFWIDKMVFWFSREGVDVRSYMNVFPAYDTSFFFASLTIVPALAVFLVKIETEFYQSYKGFYRAIADQRGWSEIYAAKEGMLRAISTSYVTLLKIQAGIALLMIGFTSTLMTVLRISESYWYIFRVGVLGIGVQVFVLITLLILLYFDFRGRVLIVSSVFLATNLIFTLLTLNAGYAFYGYGFLFASLVTLITALLLLDSGLRNLEYLTFTRQPLQPEE